MSSGVLASSNACPSCRLGHPGSARFCSQCGATLPGPQLPQRIGEYEVQGLIGEGGMGRVYRAVQPRLRRQVCIKTLLPQWQNDESTVKRFENEALTTAALRHPNIVAVYDVGRDENGAPFMVMELLEGVTLRQTLSAEAPLPLPRAAQLIDQVLAGLAEAHAVGMVHRDLKPANVMVVRQRDGTELAKVLDFGIARSIAADGATRPAQTGVLPGTPGYIAPEQIQGEAFDHRADLYAAGAMLYELLTNRRPHTARTEVQLMQKTVQQDPLPPSARTAMPVPPEADALVLKAMARSPPARFQSASEFRAALARVIGARASAGAPELERTALGAGPTLAAGSVRLLVTAVLESEGWERAKLTEALGSRLKQLFASQQVDELHQLMQSLPTAPPDVAAVIDDVALEHYDRVLGWLDVPAARPLAVHLLRRLGRSHLGRMLQSLPSLGTLSATALFAVMRTLETPRELVERLARLDAAVVRRFLETAAALSDEAFEPLLQAGVSSSSYPLRLMMLEQLSEKRASRFSSVVRQQLHDPEPHVRAAALRWVQRLEDPGAVPELTRLLARPALAPVERLELEKVRRQLQTRVLRR